MRFDDRLATLLAGQPTDVRARTAVWVQLVDVLAQDKGRLSAAERGAAITQLRQWRDSVPERRRLASAASIAGRSAQIDLIRFFAEDSAPVAAPIVSRTQLAADAWQDLLPAMPPASRALLRDRSDLPPETVRALGSFGSTDFALTDASVAAVADDDILELVEPVVIPIAPDIAPIEPVVVAIEPAIAAVVAPIADAEPQDSKPASIHDLVERIDHWRQKRRTEKAEKQAQRPIVDFAFETGADGVINWVEGAPRGGLIGLSIAAMAEPGGYGVDGQAVGAFRKRGDMREAPLTIAGEAAISGEWVLTADPRFDGGTGRFCGYLGVAKRRNARESYLTQSQLPAGSIRQLVHELRTPLNAIRGFGEMIEGQFLGPVAPDYRQRARAIVHDSGELLRVFEDLDANARLESSDYPMAPDAQVDMSEIVRAVAALHADLVEQGGIKLRIALPAREGLLAALDRPSALRMVDRMLGAALCTTVPGDVVELALHVSDSKLALSVSTTERPHREDETDSFAPLGRDFALRLATRLAERGGGRLEQRSDSFRLILPQMKDSAVANGERT